MTVETMLFCDGISPMTIEMVSVVLASCIINEHTNAIARSTSNLSTVCQGLSLTKVDKVGIVTKQD